MNLVDNPTTLSLSIAATLTILDLLIAWRLREQRFLADFWDELVPELLESPDVADRLEKDGLVEVRRNGAGQAIDLLYLGKPSNLLDDIARFLIRNYGTDERSAA
jgi:hypothetical protein